jgi:hypothetical protein
MACSLHLFPSAIDIVLPPKSTLSHANGVIER